MPNINFSDYKALTGDNTVTGWVKYNWLGVGYKPDNIIKMTFTDYANWPKWPGGNDATPNSKYQRQDSTTYGPMQYTSSVSTVKETDDCLQIKPSTDQSLNQSVRRVGWQYVLPTHEKSVYDIEFSFKITLDDSSSSTGDGWGIMTATFAEPEGNLTKDGFRFGLVSNADRTYHMQISTTDGTTLQIVYNANEIRQFSEYYKYCIRIDEVNNNWSVLDPNNKETVIANGTFAVPCVCSYLNWYSSNSKSLINMGPTYEWYGFTITKVN